MSGTASVLESHQTKIHTSGTAAVLSILDPVQNARTASARSPFGARFVLCAGTYAVEAWVSFWCDGLVQY